MCKADHRCCHSRPVQFPGKALAKHKAQIKTQNTNLKSVIRGCTGDGAIFKIDDVGQRPSGLKGAQFTCPVPMPCRSKLRRRIWSPKHVANIGRPLASKARRAPAKRLEGAGTVEMFVKNPVNFVENTVIFVKNLVLLHNQVGTRPVPVTACGDQTLPRLPG